MYVLIDRDRLVFCHKHPEHSVVSNLATIELGHIRATILPIDSGQAFGDFTTLELRWLYQNTTGHKFEGFSHLHIQELVLGVARALPVSDVNAYEVIRQAISCASDTTGHYFYVKGAFTPAKCSGLFEPDALSAQPVPVGGAGPQPAQVHTNAAPMPILAPIEPPRKGARAMIFEVADRMWNDAGNPISLVKVLALRKTIMQELETKHDVKKTTSSTALGEWQKTRCPV